MPRKRRPFIINGEPVELDAPGLKIVRGEPYWLPTKAAAVRGYVPRTVRLHYPALAFTLTDAAIMIEGPPLQLTTLVRACGMLQNEMLEWMTDPEGQGKPVYDGTIRALIACYQTDPESPYRGLRENTRRCYDDWCKTLDRAVGAKRVDRLNGRDLRKWFMEIMAPSERGGPPRVRLARGCVRQMMPILLSYGAEIGLPGCLELAQVLDRMTLRVPSETRREWKASRPRKIAMTFDHAAAIVRAGLARGTRRHRSVALGVAAQFEFTLRQIDVIGTWERVEGRAILPTDILRRGKVWRPGLCYEHFVDGTLDLSTSKNDKDALFDVSAYPLFVEAISSVPKVERRGPLVVGDLGEPLFRRHYVDLYTELARAAGVPDEIWNMRARHGGITEAQESGVDIVDTSKHAQHSNISTTTRHYVMPSIETSRRVAGKRVAHRKRKEAS
jgi:hypothetical protein